MSKKKKVTLQIKTAGGEVWIFGLKGGQNKEAREALLDLLHGLAEVEAVFW